MDKLADILVLKEFAAIRGGKALLHFSEKPFVVAEHALNGLDDESLSVAPLLRSSARELFFQFWIQAHFHAASLGAAKDRVNNALSSFQRH